jgi:hypothetical protein
VIETVVINEEMAGGMYSAQVKLIQVSCPTIPSITAVKAGEPTKDAAVSEHRI